MVDIRKSLDVAHSLKSLSAVRN